MTSPVAWLIAQSAIRIHVGMPKDITNRIALSFLMIESFTLKAVPGLRVWCSVVLYLCRCVDEVLIVPGKGVISDRKCHFPSRGQLSIIEGFLA
jgi:hypothetical protein